MLLGRSLGSVSLASPPVRTCGRHSVHRRWLSEQHQAPSHHLNAGKGGSQCWVGIHRIRAHTPLPHPELARLSPVTGDPEPAWAVGRRYPLPSTVSYPRPLSVAPCRRRGPDQASPGGPAGSAPVTWTRPTSLQTSVFCPPNRTSESRSACVAGGQNPPRCASWVGSFSRGQRGDDPEGDCKWQPHQRLTGGCSTRSQSAQPKLGYTKECLWDG